MSGYPFTYYERPSSQLELSRTAADRHAVLSALAQARTARRATGTPVRRLRRSVARYLVSTARLVDAS